MFRILLIIERFVIGKLLIEFQWNWNSRIGRGKKYALFNKCFQSIFNQFLCSKCQTKRKHVVGNLVCVSFHYWCFINSRWDHLSRVYQSSYSRVACGVGATTFHVLVETSGLYLLFMIKKKKNQNKSRTRASRGWKITFHFKYRLLVSRFDSRHNVAQKNKYQMQILFREIQSIGCVAYISFYVIVSM